MSAIADIKAEYDLAQARVDLDLSRIKLANDRRHLVRSASNDEATRIYTFTGDVNDGNVRRAMENIGQWARQDAGPIHVVLNTPGGSVFAGLALFDFLRLIQKQGVEVTTTAVGYAASMGSILLQAGGTRLIAPNAWVLIHEVSSWAAGTTSSLKDSAAFSERLTDQLLGILAERSTLSVDEIRNRSERRDYWINAKECLVIGLVDGIAA